MQVFLCLLGIFKAFLSNFDWQYCKDSVSDNFSFVIGDSVSSNDIYRMKTQRLDNSNNTIINHLNLNINSFRNKFVFFNDTRELFDVFLNCESKLDHIFPSNQFENNDYKIFRVDCSRFEGGLIIYVNEDIPCKPSQEHEHLSNQFWLLLNQRKAATKKL